MARSPEWYALFGATFLQGFLSFAFPLLPGGISVSGGSPRKDRTSGRSHSITSSMSALAARSTTLCAVGEMFGVSLLPAGSETGEQ